jgi:carboxyl-terminal processing protease
MQPESEKQFFSNNLPENQANNFLKNFLLIAIGMLLAYFFLNNKPKIVNQSTKFDELLDIIERNYVDTLDFSKIENKAVANLLATLDPHSIYIPKEDLIQSNEPLEGNFEGIGIEFFISNDTLIVVAPISGGPSELAGIKSGDKIIQINDTIIAGKKISNADVFKKLRGKKGTLVKLGVLKSNSSKITQVEIKRNTIQVNSVEKGILISDKTGYIKINSFGEKTYNEFRTELAKLVGNKKIDKLVIDLRQNTGGYLETAVSILDELIDQNKLLVYTKGRNYNTEKYITKTKGLFETGKIAVLIDEGSASASEIMAGAIQDLDRGVVIGRRSFGKGLVQSQISLSDGSAVRLTVAKYYTASGRNIQKPYKNNLEYEEEILKRYEKGEFFDDKNIKSEDTAVFYTLSGRKVKGGGGIYPDYFVSLDTNFDIHNYSILRSMIPDFIYSNHSQYLDLYKNYKSFEDFDNKYQVDAATMNSFYQYVKNNKVAFKLNRINTFDKKLKMTLKAYIAKQLYKSEGFYQITNKTDLVIQKSIEVLNPKIK